MKLLRTIIALVTLVFLITEAHTQERAGQDQDRQTAARYFLGNKNELLMAINILGPVAKPGQYMVPSETDLLTLLAYAGGLRDEANISDVKVIRRISGQAKPKTIKIDLTKLYETGDDELPPGLLPGDIVIIGKKNVVTSRVIADILRSVAFAAQTVYIIFLISTD